MEGEGRRRDRERQRQKDREVGEAEKWGERQKGSCFSERKMEREPLTTIYLVLCIRNKLELT